MSEEGGEGMREELERLLVEREAWTQETEGLRDTVRIKDKILQDRQDTIDKYKEQVLGVGG